MLYRTLVEPGLLEVKEVVMGFSSTTRRYWYYDLKSWMVSSHGKEGDKPDRAMTPKDIEWVKTHHLARLMSREQIAALCAAPSLTK